MVVYKAVCNSTGKMYIGQTVHSLEKRWIQHCVPRSSCKGLARAIKKYGKESFTVSIMSKASSLEELNHREQYYIRLFNTLAPNGYNLMTGGGNSYLSEEAAKRKSEALKRHYLTHKRPITSEETRKKISAAGKGRKKPPGTTEKRLKTRPPKKVYQYDLEGNFIAEFESLKKISEYFKTDARSNIGPVCLGKRRKAYGFQWRYKKFDKIEKVRKKHSPKRKKQSYFNNRSRQVGKYDENMDLLQTYCSVAEAAKKNKCDKSTVLKVCKGLYSKTKGILFKFL